MRVSDQWQYMCCGESGWRRWLPKWGRHLSKEPVQKMCRLTLAILRVRLCQFLRVFPSSLRQKKGMLPRVSGCLVGVVCGVYRSDRVVSMACAPIETEMLLCSVRSSVPGVGQPHVMFGSTARGSSLHFLHTQAGKLVGERIGNGSGLF